VHYGGDDRLRRQDWVDAFLADAAAAGAEVECFDYPGAGHLFTDASRPDEYDPDATTQLWSRVLGFCASIG
jgi:dienelactone hydrolase